MNKVSKDINGIKIYKWKKEKVTAIILAILPIFSPYALIGKISVNMFLIGIAMIILMLSKGKFDKKVVRPIAVLWVMHLGLSVISLFTVSINMALVNSIISITYTIVCIGLLWSNCNIEEFVKYANYTGIFCCLFIFLQAIFLAVGLEPPSGRIFNMELLKNAGFVSTTWGFRLNSVFQEPSYFAIFTLPLLAVNLQKRKFATCFMYITGLILSSSSLGFVGIVITIAWYFLAEKRNIKQLLLITIIIFIFHIIMYNTIPYYYYSFNRSLDKFLLIFESNNNIRLTGQISLFNYLPITNQIIGIGVNQMQNYFMGIIYGVYNYSNSFVVTLINTGIIGLIIYLLFIFYSINRAKKTNRLIFILIFILIAATDYFIYNYFFFYILAFIYLNSESRGNDESTIYNIEGNRNKLISYNK